MLLNDYQTRARVLAVYPNKGSNLRYTLMGLAGEAGELAAAVLQGMPMEHSLQWGNDDGRVKESSDVIWYVANVAAEMSLTFSEALGTPRHNVAVHVSIMANALEVCAAAGKALEIQKKLDRDGGDRDGGDLSDERRSAILEHLRTIMIYLVGVLPVGCNLGDAMIANLVKLEGRKERGTIHGSGDDR